jgi:hypothetical protein
MGNMNAECARLRAALTQIKDYEVIEGKGPWFAFEHVRTIAGEALVEARDGRRVDAEAIPLKADSPAKAVSPAADCVGRGASTFKRSEV